MPPLTAMPETVVPAAGAVGRDCGAKRPRVGVGDVPVEPGWWEADGEVALLLGAGRDQVGEGVRGGDEVGELGDRDAEGQALVAWATTRRGPPNQFA